MDPHLVEETIFTSQATPHPIQILTQDLDTTTVHHPGHSFGSSFTQSFLAGSYNFQPDEIEVFYETI